MSEFPDDLKYAATHEWVRVEEMSVVEAVKAASDIYAPVSGEVIAVNEDLTDAPETMNSSPYSDGWLCRILPSNPSELEELLDADTYAGMCE